jgi:ABC-type antimicrobial peptide transport system permease subunit
MVLINETMARTVWAGENPIGQMIQTDGRANPPRRVVGVVADVKHQGLENVSGNEVYEPIRQTDSYSSVYLVVRSAIPPSSLASSVRGVLRPLAPELSGSEFKTIQQLVDTAVSPRRLVVGLLGGFSIFALVLAALGIYAVISYSVAQRTAELGIRIALGASAGDLQARIMMQTLRLAALGMLIGSAVSWSLGRVLGSMLFGITFTDPVTFVGMMIALTVVALLAGYVPSLRVSRIDPIKALRTS